MTAELGSRVPTLVVGGVLVLVLSGCTTSLGLDVAGPGMAPRMGQGSSRCATAAPHAGITVDAVLMDTGRHSMMSRRGGARTPAGVGRMAAGAWRMPG